MIGDALVAWIDLGSTVSVLSVKSGRSASIAGVVLSTGLAVAQAERMRTTISRQQLTLCTQWPVRSIVFPVKFSVLRSFDDNDRTYAVSIQI